MRFSQTSSGGLEQLMLPNQLPTDKDPNPKRKIEGENNFATAKRARNENERSHGKSARTEEIKGGFIITRGRPQLNTQNTKGSGSRAPPIQLDNESANIAGPSKPRVNTVPKASFPDTSTTRQRKRGLDRELVGEGAGDQEVEEDVRQMNTEAEDLRDRTRASMANMTPAAQRVQLQLPTARPVTSHAPNPRSHQLRGSAYSRDRDTTPTRPIRDGMVPVTEQETPQIAKNRLFRGEQKGLVDPTNRQAMNNLGRGTTPTEETPSRRRSSMSMRGKRSSSAFETTGIITLPHTSVSDMSLYKHIDPDLPESQRLRQLLIWVASRAMDHSLKNRGRKSIVTQQPPNLNLPPLPPGGAEILKDIQEDIVRQIAEKKIDTSTFSEAIEATEKFALKENEQNVKNKAREKRFSQQIEERKKEDLAWAEVAQFYNAYQENILSAIKSSIKAKGKQRATSQELEDLEPWENELSEAFRGQKGYDIAKQLSDLGMENVGKGDARRAELQYKEDVLHSSISTTHRFAQIATNDLDKRFSLLNITLAQRSLPSSITTTHNTLQTLANFIPAISIPPETKRMSAPDPQELLRAISRADATRPVTQIGDAARRAARDVQRVQELRAHQDGTMLAMSERKLTEVPPTPRKPPGTPKRPTTPGHRR